MVMKQIVAGIVAHVDAGKTTLSEALLYHAGTVRQLGRVDKGDAFLDPEALEKQRGITIFSHQARLTYDDLELTLLDTPGHVDFAAQAEQVLSVLDVAVLVVSALEGVQGHTRTLWQLLQRYQVPTVIFVNKMDTNDREASRILAQLQQALAPGCLAFSTDLMPALQEEIALQDEQVLDQFMATEQLSDATVRQMIQRRQIFPCYFGSALKLTGITELLAGLQQWTTQPTPQPDFGARVFKISRDEKGERLTWVRLTGGTLKTKAVVVDDEKINQIRRYNGLKYTVIPVAISGDVYALTGLTTTYPGQGLGQLKDAQRPVLQPVLNVALDPQGNDIQVCLAALRQLEEEDPELHVTWSEPLQELRVQIMGTVQLEVLQQLLQQRFDLAVTFGAGSILYQETITQPIEGVGHFEPLRHYSEVHLLLEPTAPGSGVTFASDCSLEVLGRNWQHQVLSSLQAKTHLGVLTGAPLTDVKISLIGGKASNVHSVGGDFREATWQAVRQGLMMLQAQQACQLLEPWYQFQLTVPTEQVGRVMTDVQRMSGTCTLAEQAASTMATLVGTAPVSEMQGYAQAVHAYTHGQGQLACQVLGYQPCHNATEVIATANYDPVGDLENTPGSVFCAHGAGYPVHWDDVPAMAHCPYRDETKSVLFDNAKNHYNR